MVVLLVGTNNHGHTAAQVTDGILAIVDAIQLKQPKAHIVVMVSVLVIIRMLKYRLHFIIHV